MMSSMRTIYASRPRAAPTCENSSTLCPCAFSFGSSLSSSTIFPDALSSASSVSSSPFSSGFFSSTLHPVQPPARISLRMDSSAPRMRKGWLQHLRSSIMMFISDGRFLLSLPTLRLTPQPRPYNTLVLWSYTAR